VLRLRPGLAGSAAPAEKKAWYRGIMYGLAESAWEWLGWLPQRIRNREMKDGIHPNYREVCFLDLSNNFKFVTRSCVNTKEMVKMDDGRELPLYKLDTSSESHPFYTGTQKSVDNMGGRVEKFRNRFGKTAAK
jgi:large subunit ribosomal protein L31